MDTLNVYQQDFSAACDLGGVPRHAARVLLTVDSGGGQVCYKAAVNFFRHEDAEDFSIDCDGYFDTALFEGKGRRSKKREAALLSEFRTHADAIAAAQGGSIDWAAPLGAARNG